MESSQLVSATPQEHDYECCVGGSVDSMFYLCDYGYHRCASVEGLGVQNKALKATHFSDFLAP